MNMSGYSQRETSYVFHVIILYSIIAFSLCQGGCIKPSCVRYNYSTACLFCQNEDAVLYGREQLKYAAKTLTDMLNAGIEEHGFIWMDFGDPGCQHTDGGQKTCRPVALEKGDTVRPTINDSCSQEFHFFCYHSDDSKCGTCAPLQTQTADSSSETETASAASATTLLTPTVPDAWSTAPDAQHTTGKVLVISSVGFVSLVAIILGVVFFLRYRRKKLTQNRVRDESACEMYDVESREPENETRQGVKQYATMDEYNSKDEY